jgi:hypothetical protein
MAKPIGKLPADFMRLEQTKQFIEVLKKRSNMGNPIIESSAGNQGGTWAHQKLALKFAAWLNPRFELWVYDRIEELLRDGYTKLENIFFVNLSHGSFRCQVDNISFFRNLLFGTR